MTSQKLQTASGPQKPDYSTAQVQRIRGLVLATLLEKTPDLDPSLVTSARIRAALNWKSVYEARVNDSDEWIPLAPDHQAENISSYLSRNLKKVVPSEQQLAAPVLREIDSAHGVAYALALALREDARRSTLVRSCRQHYWKMDAAPFPWISAHGKDLREQAYEAGDAWLREHSENDGSGVLQFHGKLQVNRARQTQNAFDAMVENLNDSKAWEEDYMGPIIPAEEVLGPLSHVLREQGSVVRGEKFFDFTAAGFHISWDGPKLLFGPYEYRVVSDGSLVMLYQTCIRLALGLGWSEKKALAYILTDDPPVPKMSAPTEKLTLRRPKALSFDHIALLQLLYMTPGETWTIRLHKWDEWLRLLPDEGFTMRFQNRNSGELPTSDFQRQAWMRSESHRALQRALSFTPFIIKER
ncbi:hypothetical protein HLB42_08930 [Deinococcus sp. D7000]|nr:hypothetical protein HLB42_08930 [Deinococcus sp. D7000]